MALTGVNNGADEPKNKYPNLRKYFRDGPCRFGWHFNVLTWDGLKYFAMCEHCGVRNGSR